MSQKPSRKGARSIASIPSDILMALNRGTLETASLVEMLAVDQGELLNHVLSDLSRHGYVDPVEQALRALPIRTFNHMTRTIGHHLAVLAIHKKDMTLQNLLIHHQSDMVRCWAAYMTAGMPIRTRSEVFSAIRPLACDTHFGVREVAWMAVRDHVIDHPDECIALLSAWAADENEYIRRFASEVTRPRGVWCRHVPALKACPAKALPILDALKSDSSKYVRDSVANWINDAGKSDVRFVIDLCHRWQSQSQTAETAHIIRRALRNIPQAQHNEKP